MLSSDKHFKQNKQTKQIKYNEQSTQTKFEWYGRLRLRLVAGF